MCPLTVELCCTFNLQRTLKTSFFKYLVEKAEQETNP